MKRQDQLDRLVGLLNLLRYAIKEANNLDQKFIAYLLSMTLREIEDKLNKMATQKVS